MDTSVIVWAFLLLSNLCQSHRLVIVPSVYNEWSSNPPDWAFNKTFQSLHNYTTFVYQKLNKTEPNYIPYNRGTEAGVYLRYIVDHYDDLPDITVFIHAKPEHHNANWFDAVKCIRPNATYSSLVFSQICRSHVFGMNDRRLPYQVAVWVEQCYRDVISLAWNMTLSELKSIIPVTYPITTCFLICQHFFASREWLRRRPLETWKKLLHIIGEQDTCHVGEPDYDNLFSRARVGPEPADLAVMGEQQGHGIGYQVQGRTMEHLSMLVYGFYNLTDINNDNTVRCRQFYERSICPGSPCA